MHLFCIDYIVQCAQETMICMHWCCNTRNDNEIMFFLDFNPNEARNFFIVIVYLQNTRQVRQI